MSQEIEYRNLHPIPQYILMQPQTFAGLHTKDKMIYINRLNKTDFITSKICESYKTDMFHIAGRSRKREMVEPRQVICYFLREKTLLTWKQIGKMVGKDHSTAIYAHESITDYIDTNKDFRLKMSDLELSLSCTGLIEAHVYIVPIHDFIKKTVANINGVKIIELEQRNKGIRPICDARHMAIYLIRKHCGYNQEKTASFFNRDRSSLVNSNHTILNMIETDKEFNKRLAICEEIIIKHLNSLV